LGIYLAVSFTTKLEFIRMHSTHDPQRRSLINGSLALLLMSAFGCATQPPKPTPIEVDVSGVDSVPKLIQAIKKAAAGRLPDHMPDTEFISEFARTFVENARAAAENGFKIPQWVLDKLPARKVVFPVLGVMIFTAYGIQFAIPVATVITAVLGSIALMTTAIIAAISALFQPSSKI
jgi:hypothetical protein